MSFSSRQMTLPSLPRQDTATTVSSLSTSYTNLDTNDSTISSTSTLKCQKNKHKKAKRHSFEHFVPSGDPKTLKTLKVHYYPEEQSWCLVIVLAGTIVQMINHGLHLSYGLFLVALMNSFNRVPFIEAGDFQNMRVDYKFCHKFFNKVYKIKSLRKKIKIKIFHISHDKTYELTPLKKLPDIAKLNCCYLLLMQLTARGVSTKRL